MRELTKQELEETTAGGIFGWIVVGVAALCSFISGFVDGYTRPLKCN